MSTSPTPPQNDRPPPYNAEEAACFEAISSATLAEAIFKGAAISKGNKIIDKAKKAKAKERTKQPTTKKAKKGDDDHRSHNDEWGLAAKEVMRIFEVCHLAAADPFTSKWHATIVEGAAEHPLVPTGIPQVPKELHRKLPFCCQRCKSKNIWSLLGVGVLQVENDIGCIFMESVFFHDKDCHLDAKHKMPVAEFCVVDFAFDEVMGTTYDNVVARLATIPFLDALIPPPPGHPINFGKEGYNLDDRCYEYIPSERYIEIVKGLHRRAMVRFFYLLTSYLNMASEAAFTLLDLDNVKQRIRDKLPTMLPKKDTPVVANPDFHLFFFEISLLFGGHCVLSRNDPENKEGPPIDQICHEDSETKSDLVKSNEALEGEHEPGSFIVPLAVPRTICACTPMLQATAKKGQFARFHGALPCGGVTRRGEAGASKRCCALCVQLTGEIVGALS